MYTIKNLSFIIQDSEKDQDQESLQSQEESKIFDKEDNHLFFYFDGRNPYTFNREVNKKTQKVDRIFKWIDLPKNQRIYYINEFHFYSKCSEFIMLILTPTQDNPFHKRNHKEVIIFQDCGNNILELLLRSEDMFKGSFYVSYPIIVSYPHHNLFPVSENILTKIYLKVISNGNYISNVNDFISDLINDSFINENLFKITIPQYIQQLNRLVELYLVDISFKNSFSFFSPKNDSGLGICFEDKMEVKTLQRIPYIEELQIYDKNFNLDTKFTIRYSDVDFYIIAQILNNILKWDIVEEIDVNNSKIISFKIITPDEKYYIDIYDIFSIEEYLKYNSNSEFRKLVSINPIPSDIWSEVRVAASILHQLNLPWYFQMRSVSLMQKEPMEEMNFNFDQDIQVQFSQGDCGYLALDLYYKLRWDIYAVYFLSNDIEIPNNFGKHTYNENSDEYKISMKFIDDIKQKYEASHYINLVPTTVPQLLMSSSNSDDQSLFVYIMGVTSFMNSIEY